MTTGAGYSATSRRVAALARAACLAHRNITSGLAGCETAGVLIVFLWSLEFTQVCSGDCHTEWFVFLRNYYSEMWYVMLHNS